MTKKTRILFVSCIGFISAVFIFTSGFLIYLHTNSASEMNSFTESGTASSYAILSFDDLYGLVFVFLLLIGFVYIIIKS